MRDLITSKDYENRVFEYTNSGVKTKPENIIPEKIYKYYALNQNNVEALEKNCLYASHPYQLNDTFDSSDVLLDFRNINQQIFRGFYIKLLKEKYNDSEIYEEFKVDRLQNFRNFRKTFVSSLSNKFGNISLTTNYENILMWSHYCEQNGFCIAFDTNEIINNYKILNNDINKLFFRKMQYVEEIETIDISKFEGFIAPFLYMTSIKDKIWSYEDEYRITVFKKNMEVPFNLRYNLNNSKGENDRYLKYKKDAIKYIILGELFFNNKFWYVSDNTLKIKICEESFVFENLINLLHDKYNHKLCIVNQILSGNKLKKVLSRITLERIKLNEFKIFYIGENYMFS